MNKLLVIFLLLLFSAICHSQCDVFSGLLHKGDQLLADAQPDFQEAINAYTAAIIACPERAQEAQARIATMVEEIDALRIKAQSSQKDATHKLMAARDTLAKNEETQRVTSLALDSVQTVERTIAKNLESAKTERELAIKALNQASKVIDAFYFYNNRFALTYGKISGDLVYFFIDKYGDHVQKLGTWGEAEQFEAKNGLAKVQPQYQKKQQFLIDTSGNLYSLKYNERDIREDTRALDLSNRRLKRVPRRVFLKSQLSILLLDHNNIETLPIRIFRLQNLEVLDIRSNRFSSLTEGISQLGKLRILNATDNELTYLPSTIGQLQNLTTLDLSRNSLSSLPESFGQLQNLALLDLSRNSLSSLSENFGQLQNLNSLDLSSNSLGSLPESFGQLQNLNSLDLSNNSLGSLPENFRQLQNLNSLDLSNNSLSSLPENFRQLQNLNSLHLENNPIDSLPPILLQQHIIPMATILVLLQNCTTENNFDFARQIGLHIRNYSFSLSELFNLSWWLVNCQDYESAIWAGEAYLSAGGSDVGALSNLALGYLYNGEYDKAMAIYEAHLETKGSRNRTGRDIFLQDLAGTAHLEVKDPEAVTRIKTFLEEQ